MRVARRHRVKVLNLRDDCVTISSYGYAKASIREDRNDALRRPALLAPIDLNMPDDDDLPEAPDAPEASKRGNVREWLLAGIAVLSLGLNGYLAYDKWAQEKVSQPGPHASRVFIDGANSAALEAVHKTADAFSEMYSRPSIADTPDWTTLVADQKKLPPIALRNQTIRFLALQNFTASAYEEVKIVTPSLTIAFLPV